MSFKPCRRRLQERGKVEGSVKSAAGGVEVFRITGTLLVRGGLAVAGRGGGLAVAGGVRGSASRACCWRGCSRGGLAVAGGAWL